MKFCDFGLSSKTTSGILEIIAFGQINWHEFLHGSAIHCSEEIAAMATPAHRWC